MGLRRSPLIGRKYIMHFVARTVKELIWSIRDAWDDNSIGAVILTGVAKRLFVPAAIKVIKGIADTIVRGG